MSKITSSDHYKYLVNEIINCGGSIIGLNNGKKHGRLLFSIQGIELFVSIPCTPASYNSKEVAKKQIRTIIRARFPDFEFNNDKSGSKISKRRPSNKNHRENINTPTETRLSGNPFEILKYTDLYRTVYHAKETKIKGS